MTARGSSFRCGSGLRAYFYLLMAIWTASVAASVAVGIYELKSGTIRIADFVARAHVDKDQAMRLWVASHGGVYVPVKEGTSPNPYLAHVPDRDIQTPSGVRLTLLNPAYMLRLIHEEFNQYWGVQGHITSLTPLRPENGPDEWEVNALKSFEAGAAEAIEIAENGGKRHLRFMKPMEASKSCAKCHEECSSGKRVRGAVAAKVPLEPFLEIERREIATLAISHGSLYLIGMLGLVVGMRRLERRDAELERAHEAVRASEEKYRALFDDSMDGVFMTSREGKLIEMNRALEELLGSTRKKMLGEDVRTLCDDPEDRNLLIEALEREGRVKDHPVRLTRTDGAVADCVVTATVRRANDGSVLGYQGIVRDVTEQWRAQRALEKQTAELQRSNSELESFAYRVSHDLQEPLRNIVNSVQLLEKKYGANLGPEADTLAKYSTTSAFRMKTLIDDLLAYSRVGSHRAVFDRVDCESVLRAAMENLTTAISESGAEITHDSLPTIIADKIQFIQLFQNLLSNAIKFRAVENPRIHVAVSKQSSGWLFSFKDNGIGIEKDYVDRIFGLFSRLHSQQEYEGTGLGLAIVKKIISLHGGKIWVETELGRGSTFYFTIPDTNMNRQE